MGKASPLVKARASVRALASSTAVVSAAVCGSSAVFALASTVLKPTGPVAAGASADANHCGKASASGWAAASSAGSVCATVPRLLSAFELATAASPAAENALPRPLPIIWTKASRKEFSSAGAAPGSPAFCCSALACARLTVVGVGADAAIGKLVMIHPSYEITSHVTSGCLRCHQHARPQESPSTQSCPVLFAPAWPRSHVAHGDGAAPGSRRT